MHFVGGFLGGIIGLLFWLIFAILLFRWIARERAPPHIRQFQKSKPLWPFQRDRKESSGTGALLVCLLILGLIWLIWG